MTLNSTYISGMRAGIVFSIVALILVAIAPSTAQIIPTPPALENRIPAPLPPPPPVINGPLGQSPPPGVHVPPRVNTHGDRVVGCLHQGRSSGLRGDALQSYARECANAN